MIPNSPGGGPGFESRWNQSKNPKDPVSKSKKLNRKPPMTQNDSESTITTFFGQNRPKPHLSVKIDQNLLFRSKTSFSSQNQPKPLFLAKIHQYQFFFCSKPSFSVQNRRRPLFFWPKSTETTFFGKNRPKPVFPVKTQFLGPKSTETSGRNSGRKTEK